MIVNLKKYSQKTQNLMQTTIRLLFFIRLKYSKMILVIVNRVQEQDFQTISEKEKFEQTMLIFF